MVGNFIGDFVKGRNVLEQFEADIAKGIELHRSIDEFTDHHPVVQISKMRLRPKYRHYAAVIVDIFYDHLLSRYWNNYHTEPLENFSQDTYTILQQHRNVLPIPVKNLLPYMIRDNWLLNYGTFDGIGKALTGISRRARHDSRMDESIHDLREYYEEFKSEFELFFPDLKKHSEEFLFDNNVN
ncbi:MAG TPA: acyl carrier protein phosphodiesterase [Chryseolinea sp.]